MFFIRAEPARSGFDGVGRFRMVGEMAALAENAALRRTEHSRKRPILSRREAAMLTSCLISTGRTAHVPIPSVPDTTREGQQRVETSRSPPRLAMTAICAKAKSRIDVNR
jgi:hypothetical protein